MSNPVADSIAAAEILQAPYVMEYTYRRSLGPVVGAYFTALRDGRILGARTRGGRVISPPLEWDPETGEPIAELVELAPTGTVQSWTWVALPEARHPLTEPFAWALVKLDGADTATLVPVLAPEALLARGLRVTVRWAESRTGTVRDIACFVPA
jgi:uncharacterized OB-fold protein